MTCVETLTIFISNNAAINILQEGLKILSRNTDGRSGSDKSLKPVDTGYNGNLEQEQVIASNSQDYFATPGKSTVFSSC